MRKHQIYLVLFWLALSAFVSIYSYKLGLGKISAPGPGLMPFCVGVLFFVFALYSLVGLLVTLKPQQGEMAQEKGRGRTFGKLGGVVGVLLVYALLLDVLGYLIATFLAMTIFFWITGVNRWVFAVTYSMSTVLATYFLFTYLGVLLPSGILKYIGLH